MKHPLISISECSRLTGKTRETVSRAAGGLPSHPGPRNATLYDSTKLLARLYVGEDGELTYGEAMRKLTIARTRQVDVATEIARKERIPLQDVLAVHNEVFMSIAGILKADCGKLLSQERINEMLTSLRDVGDRLATSANGQNSG
jgi:hypothetical protein